MDALIESITELVLAELQAPQKPDLPGRKLLLCPARGTDLSGPVYDALRKLDVGWLVTVWPGFDEAQVNRALGGRPWRPASGSPDDLVRSVQAVILPSLTLELLPRLAILLGDLPPVQMAIAGLVQGVPVLAASEEADRFQRHAARLPSKLCGVVQQHLQTVQHLGVQLYPAEALVQQLTHPQAQAAPRQGRDVITEEDLLRAVQAGQKVFEVSPGAIVTPLARETARVRGIEVRHL